MRSDTEKPRRRLRAFLLNLRSLGIACFCPSSWSAAASVVVVVVRPLLLLQLRRRSCRHTPDARHSSATRSIRHNHPGIVAIIVPRSRSTDGSDDDDGRRRLLPAAVRNLHQPNLFRNASTPPAPGRDLGSLAARSDRLSLISRFVGNGRLNREELMLSFLFRVTKQRRRRCGW